MGHNKIKTVNTPATKNRAERAKRRYLTHVPDLTESINQESLEHGDEATNAIPDQTLPVDMPEIQEVETSTCTTSQDNFLIGITPQATKQNAECQTDLSVQDIRNMEYFINSSTAEIVDMKKIIIDLEKKVLERTLSQKSFQNNDAKARFYTGLPNFAILLSVFNLVAPYVISTSRNALPKFNEFVLVLMRLRLNLQLQDLAYRFNISPTTAFRICEKWIDAMNEKLSFLIWWPEREQLWKTMPRIFKKNFGSRVAVIIDCFEVFIDRPSSLIARAMTWSNYKHHNTVKFLIGITPQGAISFISNAWGGRVSDKYLTENSGFLKKLLPGDIVLADRGFDIADSVGLCRASLKIPAFTRGKNQLSALDVEETRKIANVRIHVERVIGLVRRKYTILQTILPIEFVSAKQGQTEAPIDKIARVCCALTNLSDSVVPFE
ncbi:uncharacterized protein LOC114575292 [Exaiptasia diaphana]|uniref:Transposase n=1 Tax=Exaiptasia diaphana TaxID=2652724 RepID=A0A913YN56_EXADI|nr:uncharacterized protein LOC114575292 [Exaiptasia diaphana]